MLSDFNQDSFEEEISEVNYFDRINNSANQIGIIRHLEQSNLYFLPKYKI